MNNQGKLLNGLWQGGIEWTRWIEPDGTIRPGFTWNAVGGCEHDCEWQMPDGNWAQCYAKTVAHGAAMKAYPEGFKSHYWRPHLLKEPRKVKETAGIFLDSMSDLMGANVPTEQIDQVIEVCRQAHWHRFFVLTKNAPRLLKFDWPSNCIVGVSMPPTKMHGQVLTFGQQVAYTAKALKVLTELRGRGLTTWMSFEPLSWNVAPLVADAPGALTWAVIGAASKGRTLYQPAATDVQGLLDVLDRQGVAVFFKGNLAWSPWREAFPTHEVIPV
jgi:protein gp37